MDSQAPAKPAAGAFTPASSLLELREGRRLLGSGVKALDELTGGFEPGLLYLLYGEEKSSLPDEALHLLLIQAVEGGGNAVHLICGNYRRSRTLLDVALLLDLIEGRGLNEAEALSRIHVVCSFSERQQARSAALTEELVERLGDVSVVTVQQIAKMWSGTPLVGGAQRGELGKMASSLKRLGLRDGFPVVASCRCSGRGEPTPMPEGGSYLSHLANVVVYLRAVKGGGASAIVVKHYDGARAGRRISFGECDGLGRVTGASMRQILQDKMIQLREKYRGALKDPGRRNAFDRLWEGWASEQGAMVNSDVVSALDLLLLTAVVDNRMEIEELRRILAGRGGGEG